MAYIQNLHGTRQRQSAYTTYDDTLLSTPEREPDPSPELMNQGIAANQHQKKVTTGLATMRLASTNAKSEAVRRRS